MQRVDSQLAEAAYDRLLALLDHAQAAEERRRVWLDDRIHEPLIAYLRAQMRMRIRPALYPGWLSEDPVHISLFGGTNSGKSTVVNVCLGRAAAGMHATARFSQHPEAYRPAALGNAWLNAYPSRFSGYHRYHDEHPPRQSDRDLVQHGYTPAFAVLDPAHLPGTPMTMPATTRAVFWDAPDFSTEAAQSYLSAVLDVAALADIVVMAVTDESYADNRGCALVRLVSDSGVQLHIVANKLNTNPELLADIKHTMNAHWRGPGKQLPEEQWHALPRVSGTTPTERLHNLLVTHPAIALRESLAQAVDQGNILKRRVLVNTLQFFERRLDDVLRVLLLEAEVAMAWEHTVTQLVRQECLARYRSEYLQGHRYGELNQTLIRVMELLEVPGIGPAVKRLTDVVRMPFRMVTGFLLRHWKGTTAPTTQRPPEAEVLLRLFGGCLTALKAEAQNLAAAQTHPVWQTVVSKLDSRDWYTQLEEDFENAYQDYRQKIDAELQRRALEIYDTIAQRPNLLNILRGANLALDAATLALIVKSGGLNWSDAIVGPVVAGLRRTLMEAGLDQYLRKQAEILQHKQFEAIEALLMTHLIRPVCQLFTGAVRREDIEAARYDLATLTAAVLQRTREDTA